MDYMRIWLELLDDEDGVLLDGIQSKAVQEELLKIDVRTRQFCGRDRAPPHPLGPATARLAMTLRSVASVAAAAPPGSQWPSASGAVALCCCGCSL